MGLNYAHPAVHPDRRFDETMTTCQPGISGSQQQQQAVPESCHEKWSLQDTFHREISASSMFSFGKLLSRARPRYAFALPTLLALNPPPTRAQPSISSFSLRADIAFRRVSGRPPPKTGALALSRHTSEKGCLHDSRRAGRTALGWRKVGFSLFAFYLLLPHVSITHACLRACQLCLPYFRFARGAEVGSGSRFYGSSFDGNKVACLPCTHALAICNLQPAARPGLPTRNSNPPLYICLFLCMLLLGL